MCGHGVPMGVPMLGLPSRLQDAPPGSRLPRCLTRSLTIVLPAFNEEARLGPALDELFGYLHRRGHVARDGRPGAEELPAAVDVLVVDDGSTDGTADLVRARPEARGGGSQAAHGPAWGQGVRRSRRDARRDRDLVVFADADMATPPDEIAPMVEALASADAVYGSRIQPDGSDMRKSQPAWRRGLGKAFHLLASVWVVGPVQDTQCGFKGFHREVARDVFARQRITSIVFDVELIYLVRRRGYSLQRRAHPLGGPPRLAHAPGAAARHPRGVGPVPDPAPPPGRAPGGPRDDRGSRGLRWVSGRSPGLGRSPAGRCRCLPIVALLVIGLTAGATLAVAGDTLGYDFLAYHAAAARVLDGQPAYDTSFEAAGGFGLFYYPPTFIPLVLLFGLLPAELATWALDGPSSARRSALASAAMPVSTRDALADRAAGRAVVAVPVRASSWARWVRCCSSLFAVGWRWIDAAGRAGAHRCTRGGDQDPARAGPRLGAPHPALGGRARGCRRAGAARRALPRSSRAPGPGRTSSR